MKREISLATRFRVLRRDHFTCMYCGQRPPAVTLQVDHVVAFSAGGPNDERNLLTACNLCNQGKSDSDARPWRPEPYRYTPIRECKCPRPFCAGPYGNVAAKDDLERGCPCVGCHDCDVCGSGACDRARFDKPEDHDPFEGCLSVEYAHKFGIRLIDAGSDPWVIRDPQVSAGAAWARDEYMKPVREDLKQELRRKLSDAWNNYRVHREDLARNEVPPNPEPEY